MQPTELIEVPVYARLGLDVVSAEGAEICLSDGTRLLDFYAGHAVVCGSHSDSLLAAKLGEQASRLRFQTSLVHSEERDLALSALIDFAGPDFSRAFLVNSGAEANENALRAAFLYHERMGKPRGKIVALESGFHGRSAAASACTWSSRKGWYGFPSRPFEVDFVPVDDCEAITAAIDNDTAAVIVEAIQGIAGARDLSIPFLEATRAAADAAGALFIADEIQCGLGRSGQAFAFSVAGIKADIVTMAKGLGGGFPVGAMLTTDAVAERLKVGDLGTTFGGAPLACCAMVHVLQQLKDGLLDRVAPLSEFIRGRCQVGPITNIQGRGLLLGLRSSIPARQVRDELLKRNILVGTSDDAHVLRLTPPYIIEEDHVERLALALSEIKA